MSSLSDYMSNNSPVNFPLILTEIKSSLIPFSLVFFTQESEQHLHSLNVFSSLPFFYSHPLIVDSLTANSNKDFENLLFHFAYESSSPFSSFLTNN
jgi:hypothetical protein